MSGKPSITRVVKFIRKGDKGDAAETYKLVASHTAVSRTFDDTGSGQTYSPGTVNVKCVKVSGNESTVLSALPAGYYIKYSRDGGTQSKNAYSSISSGIVTGTLFSGGTYHLVTFYLYNSSNQCVAAESICLNDNGKNSISYSILPSISQFKANAGRTITQTCTCKAYRTIAGKTPAQMGTNDGCVISVTGYDDNNVSHYGSDGSNQISFSTNSSNDGTYSTRFEVTLRVSNVEVAKISIPVVMDGAKGEQGPALRGPQAWSDCEVGYQFYSGAEGEPYKDIVLYNGYFYSCRKTHQKATSILPTNTTYWTLGDKVELIAANVLFAEHGFFGDAIISGQWLISANGTISGTSYTKGRQYNGELAYNLFNADSPLGDDITKYNSVQGTSISSTEATAPKGTVNLEAGRVYYMTCVGFTNVANNPLYVRLVKSDDSSVAVTPINLNSTSAVTRSGYAHIMKSGTYRIELYHNTGNGNGVLISCKIVEKCFAPVYALNLRAGKVYQNDAYISGKVEANLFYGKSRVITTASDRSYYINPETEPAGTYFINEPTNKRFVYLPDANTYEGLEIQIFTKCTNRNIDKMTFIAAQNNQSLFLKVNIIIAKSSSGAAYQAERLDKEYTNFNGTTAYMVPNEIHRFKAMNGAWYSLQGHYTGE